MPNLKLLAVQKRNTAGKGFNRRLRQGDIVPGIFYSGDGKSVSVQIAAPILNKMYSEVGRTTVFNLKIDDDKTTYPVLIWDVQRHPVKSKITHVDFYGVDLDKPVKVTVPVEFTGTARGTKVGGVLETYREEVQLVAKPLEMPAKIVLDVTDLDLGKTIQVADLKLPDGVHASYDINYAIVSVVLPGADETEEATEGETATAATTTTATTATPAAPAAQTKATEPTKKTESSKKAKA